MTNKTKGFIYGAIAAASYGMNPLFALPLYAAGMSVDTVLFYRYFFAAIVLGILMKMQHQSFALHKADVLPLVIMGLLFSFSSLLLFMSYNYFGSTQGSLPGIRSFYRTSRDNLEIKLLFRLDDY